MKEAPHALWSQYDEFDQDVRRCGMDQNTNIIDLEVNPIDIAFHFFLISLVLWFWIWT
jgi:hypothetical protein